MHVILSIWLAVVSLLTGPVAPANKDGIDLSSERLRGAIVIDDFGNSMKGTEQMLRLSFPLTVAVMPHLSSSAQDAETAFQHGHEVIIHLPLEPIKGKKSWLGPKGITHDLSDEEIRARVWAAIESVPHAVGMNNHMGSRITSDERIMRMILEICREKGLYFLDSHTTSRSVVCKLAAEMQVPCLENNLFLDDIHEVAHVDKQLARFVERIQQHKQAIAIGHVGVGGLATAEALTHFAPQRAGIELSTVSQLLGKP